jgi:hypothetical protein
MTAIGAETQSAELERRILHGLALEWRLANDQLGWTGRHDLRPPLLRFADVRRRLGQWDPRRREICFSRLLCDQPWEALRAVLRHEMAHQLVAEGFRCAAHARPHGASFQEACRLLHADPRPAVRIDQLPPRANSDPQAGAAQRIGKLLALAGSANPHEAHAALLKAHELMARHRIDALGQEPAERFASRFAGRPALRHTQDAYALANLLTEFYFVAGLWIPAFVLERGRMGRVLELSGTPADLANALYVHDFVARFIARRWDGLADRQGCGRNGRLGFALGVIAGLREKLAAAPRPEHGGEAARDLVVAADHRLTAYLRVRYPRTTRIRSAGCALDRALMARGARLGRGLEIRPGIGPDGEPDPAPKALAG